VTLLITLLDDRRIKKSFLHHVPFWTNNGVVTYTHTHTLNQQIWKDGSSPRAVNVSNYLLLAAGIYSIDNLC